MLTGSFFTTAGLPGRISIARWAPKGFRELPKFSPLAPGPWFKSVDHETYRRLYAEQLAKLHPGSTREVLHRLADGHEPIILCWEPPGRFCHRRLVAEWFAASLQVEVHEYPGEHPRLPLNSLRMG